MAAPRDDGEIEIKRLEKRESDLQDTLERRETELIDERDGYRMKLNNLLSQFHTAGAIILKCIDAAQNNAGPNISLTALGGEIEKVAEQEQQAQAEPRPASTDPLPSFLAAGPRIDEAAK